MRRVLIVAALAGVVLAAALASCGGKAQRPGTIRVAVLATKAEPLAKQGEMMRLGAQLKADELNASGGLKGRRLELVFYDGGCDPGRAEAVCRKLAEDETIALVLGPLCSGAAKAAEPALHRADLPTILPVASAEYLGRPSPVLFRMVPSDGRQARLLALYAAGEMGLSRVGVIFEDSQYGQVVRNAFGTEARRLGLRVVGEEPYRPRAEEAEAALKALAAREPEAILLAGDAEMGAVVARMAQRLRVKAKFLGTSVMAERTLLELGGPAVEGFTLVEPFVFEPVEEGARQFSERFQDAFLQRPTWIAASTYDALGLAATALERSASRKTLRRALAAVNSPSAGYQGATGLTYFDATGGSLRLIRIVRVEEGAFVPAPTQLEGAR